MKPSRIVAAVLLALSFTGMAISFPGWSPLFSSPSMTVAPMPPDTAVPFAVPAPPVAPDSPTPADGLPVAEDAAPPLAPDNPGSADPNPAIPRGRPLAP